MGSSGFCRRRRSHGFTVEVLEGRALLSTITNASTFQIQPTGVQGVSHHLTAPARQSQERNANAGDAVHLGRQYSKAIFSKATGTVVSDYTKALFHGNGKALKTLGNSNGIKQFNANMESVAHSSQAQAISHSFKKLGHSISNEFHKIFG
jgi:hypothetical protein